MICEYVKGLQGALADRRAQPVVVLVDADAPDPLDLAREVLTSGEYAELVAMGLPASREPAFTVR